MRHTYMSHISKTLQDLPLWNDVWLRLSNICNHKLSEILVLLSIFKENHMRLSKDCRQIYFQLYYITIFRSIMKYQI